MMKVIAVIGARPQFIKHAPFELAARGKMDLITIHTGQHYDANMSDVFFDQLKITKPSYTLSLGGGHHGEQTGAMLREIEPIVLRENPNYLLVYGDTNSTLAGALVASKLHVPVIHIEAGLRSYNKRMPEEVNRILTDHISNLLFASTQQAVENLRKEGIDQGVYLVGDIMVDTVHLAREIGVGTSPVEGSYYYATIHRPYNTDDQHRLSTIFNVLNQLEYRTVLPLHPRTKKLCADYGIKLDSFSQIDFINPVSYFENIHYIANAKHVITDSGGLQKEAYMLQVPCITLRSETEWVETLEEGWNVLCFENLQELHALLNRNFGIYRPSLYGRDGVSKRIVDIILAQR